MKPRGALPHSRQPEHPHHQTTDTLARSLPPRRGSSPKGWCKKLILLQLKKERNVQLHISDRDGNSKGWDPGRCMFSLPVSALSLGAQAG